MARWVGGYKSQKGSPISNWIPWLGTHAHSLSGIHTPFLCLSSSLVLNKTLAFGHCSEA